MASNVNIYEAAKAGQQIAVWCLTEWSSKDGARSGTRWNRIGVAFINRDGSVQLQLDCLPANGQALQIRPVEPKEGQDKGSF